MDRTTVRPMGRPGALVALGLVGVFAGSSCGPYYRDLRREGQAAMVRQAYGPARIFLEQAEELQPRQVENLHDMGVCSVMLAVRKFGDRNQAAAMREVDAAISYYGRALDVYPGHLPSLEGKNIALELKGQFEEALKHSEWGVRFVGPSAKQFLLLAREMEERRDRDGALLRYRQAVAVEPDSAEAHRAFARFLLKNGSENAAVHHLKAAFRLDPSDHWVADELAARDALSEFEGPRAAVRTP